MLVLSRKQNESLVIDGRIVVTVVGTRGNTIQLGIEAPAEVPVHRAEVAKRLALEAEGLIACGADSPGGIGRALPAQSLAGAGTMKLGGTTCVVEMPSER